MNPTLPTRLHPVRLGALLPGLLLIAVGLLGAPAAAAPAAGAKLIGKWSAEAMEVRGRRYPVKPPHRITFEYQAGGVLVVTLSMGSKTQTKRGRWRATATHVDMTVDRETRRMAWRVTGNRLVLKGKQAGVPTTYHMRRAR